MDRITVRIAADAGQTKVLATSGADEILRAVLGPASQMHPRAAATLLEGLALWHQQPLSVVLCVGDRSCGSSLGLCDALGLGSSGVHYEVGIVLAEERRRARRLGGPGDFRALRRLGITEVVR